VIKCSMFFVFKNWQKVDSNNLGKPFRQVRLLVLRLERVKERLPVKNSYLTLHTLQIPRPLLSGYRNSSAQKAF